MSRRQLAIWGVRLGVALAVLSLWTYLGNRGAGLDRIFPEPWTIFNAGSEVVSRATFLDDVRVSLQAIVLGFLIGSTAGLIIGGVIGSSSRLTEVFEPMLFWADGVPKIIFLPIMFLMLGTGVALYAGQGALSAVFPVAIGMVTAVRTIPPIYLRVGRSFGLSPVRMVAMVWAPASAGQVLTALRIGLANAIVSSLLAETVIGSQGVGYRAVRYYSTLEIPQMYALIILLFAAAMLINVGLERVIYSRTRHFEDARAVPA